MIKRLIMLFIGVFILMAQPLYAAKIELDSKGQKQIIEFDPGNKAEVTRAENMWRKADGLVFFVYSETGSFRVFDEPREDARFEEIGNWHQELYTKYPVHPNFAGMSWDKEKWHPRFWDQKSGWLKLDDPYIVWPKQLEPVKDWPIRYIAYHRGTDTAAAEEGITPKYDEYERWHFDKEGFVLDNRTLKRKKIDRNFVRMFHYRDFVHEEVVLPNDLNVSASGTAGIADVLTFDLSRRLKKPKVDYPDSTGGDSIFVWATFDDPIKPVIDKKTGVCVIDCKNKKRWTP